MMYFEVPFLNCRNHVHVPTLRTTAEGMFMCPLRDFPSSKWECAQSHVWHTVDMHMHEKLIAQPSGLHALL
jgi:hypothetical protein